MNGGVPTAEVFGGCGCGLWGPEFDEAGIDPGIGHGMDDEVFGYGEVGSCIQDFSILDEEGGIGDFFAGLRNEGNLGKGDAGFGGLVNALEGVGNGLCL